jgi:hypothetical protein
MIALSMVMLDVFAQCAPQGGREPRLRAAQGLRRRARAIAAKYIENDSGAKLARPELFRLLDDAEPGDVLLVEQVDRLSRLTSGDWHKLKDQLAAKRIRVVALDLPTSWIMTIGNGDEFTSRMFDAINGMLLDMLAAVARKDYDDRRRRQAQGQAKAKAWRLQGQARGCRAQQGHRGHARGQAILDHDPERDRLQPRHHREDREEDRLIVFDFDRRPPGDHQTLS